MEKRTEIKGNWRLLLVPNADVVKNGFEPTTVAELESAPYLKLEANVPGCMELDLHGAGLAPDPYFGKNPLEYRQYENRHLWYYTTFQCDDADADVQLCFDGIDTVAEIFLNGVMIGYADNMLIEHSFYTGGYLKQGRNELIVHIQPTMIAARNVPITPLNRTQYFNQASLAYRKAAYMFGWDIMPRFVSGGLWKPVYLVKKSDERLEQCYLYTTKVDAEKKTADLTAFVQFETEADLLDDLRITVDGVCGDSVFHMEKTPYHTYENLAIRAAENIKLWYPKNYGEQPLYDVSFRLWRGEKLLDEKSFRFGVRTIDLERTSILDADGNGKFGFIVNGKPVFCLGTNWVPLDAFPCRHKERLPKALELLEESGCNAVRCWGGNVYEDDAFYDFCDEKGILVWQDFGMGCAIYPEEESFLADLETETVTVIQRLRNHPSLALWAGDNEVDIFLKSYFKGKADPNDIPSTRKVLPKAVRNHDPMRSYIPSSPYVDSVAFEKKAKTPEDHLWGPRDYFKSPYYKNARSCFASEIGYHGSPSPKSLERFISEDQLYPVLNEMDQGTPEYLIHAASMNTDPKSPYAYRIPLMVKQVRNLFDREANDLDTFARQSQISQAEAKKYYIEKFRIGKPHCTGIIWWNLLDGWPQVSDAVIDWYYCKKLAFQFIKRSQQQLCLMFDEPDGGKIRLFAVQDGGVTRSLQYKVRDLINDRIVCEGFATVTPDCSTPIDTVAATDSLGFWLIEWSDADGNGGRNHYTTKTEHISYNDYYTALYQCGMDEFEGF